MSDEEKAAAAQPHPLAPLEAHLSGSVHNASAAVRALETWFKNELAKLRAELTQEKEGE